MDPWQSIDVVPFAAADARFALSRLADKIWGLDAIFPPEQPRPDVLIVRGGGGEVALGRGVYVIEGDLVARSLAWCAREDAVLVITGRLEVDTLVVAGPANLWVDRLVAGELVVADLSYGGSLIVSTAATAPAWLVLGDGEVVLPKRTPGRIIQPDHQLVARRFKRAEPASGALAAGIARASDVLAALADGRPIVRSTAEIGPALHGRPIATLEAVTATRDVRAFATLPDGAVFPRLATLELPDCTANAGVARLHWPVLEQLVMHGPHAIPVGTDIPSDVAIPRGMFAGMPALRRVHVRAFRDLAPALLEIPALERLDLAQEIFNPVFHKPPVPGLLLADIATLAARYPTLKLAFADDICFELPPEFATAVAAAIEVATLATRGQLREAAALVDPILDAIEQAPLLYSHVNRYDLRSLAVWIHAKLAEPEIASRHARAGLAELGPPSGWFVSKKGLASCRQLAKLAGNHLAWTERERDPVAALAHVELAVLGATPRVDDYVFDTHARILMILGRSAEAYEIVERIVRGDPGFEPVQDLATSPAFTAYLRAKE
jgi:hypothetical protein